VSCRVGCMYCVARAGHVPERDSSAKCARLPQTGRCRKSPRVLSGPTPTLRMRSPFYPILTLAVADPAPASSQAVVRVDAVPGLIGGETATRSYAVGEERHDAFHPLVRRVRTRQLLEKSAP
jgi:hypothetical protein